MKGRKRRIVFAGGGTGGHLFPGLAVAAELRERHPDAGIGWIGARRGIEQRLVPEAGYPLWSLSLGGLKGLGLVTRVRSVFGAGWAVLRCLGRMATRRPALVVGVGGYASGPAVLAASTLGVSTLVLEQNHFPGATNRWLAPRVDGVCVPSQAAADRIGGRRFVTGNPVRREIAALGDRPRSIAEDGRPRLLVFGGSRGARSVNRAMIAAMPALGKLSPAPRIVHQTGDADVDEVRAALGDHAGLDYEVHPFLDDMPERLAWADLVIARAGATTIAELAAAGLPSVLVPYPHAADDHQRHNAEALADAGAARVLLDGDAAAQLPALLEELLGNPAGLASMGQAARGVARTDATGAIADLADRLLAGEPLPREDAHVS
ncbi:hypothetical protein ABI59_12990 [Acidobacteria bacterium Mor1]|nr:hypothetical protein ABI59_12990 [Acidobacteria bacterium Mor1]